MAAAHPTLAEADPKGLMREAFCIEGIAAGECRSIFLDWALSLGSDIAPQAAIRVVLAAYGAGAEAHPMQRVLTEGLTAAQLPRGRRGGWAGRPRS